MNVLIIEPGKLPYQKDIPEGLESLQKIVGGYIECVYPFNDNAAVIVNEEGKLTSDPELNRAMYDDYGRVVDIYCGNMIIVGLGDEDFCSLTSEQTNHYKQQFYEPEVFYRTPTGQIVAESYMPDEHDIDAEINDEI